jgi:hypothetical protein
LRTRSHHSIQLKVINVCINNFLARFKKSPIQIASYYQESPHQQLLSVFLVLFFI